jgi:TFIIF-interacting CTD phosphatase-like protein
MVTKKVLVLDLDETLIHSNHDGVLRPTVKTGLPPDFVLKVTIDRHPVRFFVHKRPHVDFFLSVVSIGYLLFLYLLDILYIKKNRLVLLFILRNNNIFSRKCFGKRYLPTNDF